MSEPNLREIADRIRDHLKRIESDPALNASSRPGRDGLLWNARAYHGGQYVRVVYVSYQGATSLKRDEALAYLAWLDAGNVGRHFEQQREAKR